jgi:formylglycine-generating enzyme required for sulfatase activity
MRIQYRCALLLAVLHLSLTAHVQAQEAKVPPPPKFPFAAQVAADYQRDFAQSRSMPVEWKNELGMTLVLVPPGTFIMGSPASEPGRQGAERRHGVTLTRPFYLGQHEVTVGQFRKFVAATKYVTDVEKSGGGHAHDDKAVWEHHPGTHWQKPGYAGKYEQADDRPVVHVSHADAVAFCDWLGKMPSKMGGKEVAVKYRLPTEAEWEWACRAGSGTRFWWGEDDDASGKVANVGDEALKKMHPAWPRSVMAMNDGHAYAAPVGSYRANAFGLCDMLGNVWEFCGSRHGAYPAEPTTDPGDLSQAESFSVRGGGWSNVASDCRCATRNSDPPHFGHSNLGFRVAAELP